MAEPLAKFYSTGIHWNDQIPAGICGASLRPSGGLYSYISFLSSSIYQIIRLQTSFSPILFPILILSSRLLQSSKLFCIETGRINHFISWTKLVITLHQRWHGVSIELVLMLFDTIDNHNSSVHATLSVV